MSLLKVDNTGVVSLDTNLAKAYARNQLGFTMADKKEDALQQALTDPKTYMTNKNKRRQQLEDATLKTYTDLFTQIIKDGYPEDYAKNAAMQAAKNVAGVELGLLNLEYPDLFSNVALKETSRQVYNNLPLGGLVGRKGGSIRKARRSRRKHRK